MLIKQATTWVRVFRMVQTDHFTPKTGITPTVNISKNGAAFAAAAGTVAEIANGWYKITLTTVDTNTAGPLAYHITGTTADNVQFDDYVDPRLFTDLSLNGSGQALIASSIKQGQPLAGFPFVMTDSSNHAPATGKTVTAQRSLGGSGFSPCANPVTELSNGLYVINLAGSDLNSPTVALRFTATGCDDRVFAPIVTQP